MKLKYPTLKKLSKGFTLVELAISVPILMLTAIFLFNIIWSTVNESNYEHVRLTMVHDKQFAMTMIESDIALASRYLAGLDAGLTDPYPPTSNGGAWSYKGDSSTSRTLLLRAYSTTANPLSASRQPVFIGSGASCDDATIYFNTVQRYTIIYFVKNGNLYRRRVVNNVTATCEPHQYQKTSCPSTEDLGTNQHADCGADDELILHNVSNFTISYYPLKTSTVASDVYATGASTTLVTTATDVEITLGVSKNASGKPITSQSTLRISKLNEDL